MQLTGGTTVGTEEIPANFTSGSVSDRNDYNLKSGSHCSTQNRSLIWNNLDKIIQTLVLLFTIIMAFEKYDDQRDVFKSALYVFIFMVIQQVIYPIECRFDYIYALYLPFMISLLFRNKQQSTINTALALNASSTNGFDSFVSLIFILLEDNSNYSFIISTISLILNGAFFNALVKVGDLKSLDAIDCNIFSILLTNVTLNSYGDYSLQFSVLHGTLMSFFIVVLINYYVISKMCRFFGIGSYGRSLALFLTLVIGFPLLVNELTKIPDSQLPSSWLLKYILESNTRLTILAIWLTFMIVLVPNVLLMKSKISLNTSRKIWHFLILVLIMSPFQMDKTFVKIALAGTITMFLCVEYLRYLRLYPVGEYLDEMLRSFADFRDDKGPIIISYIYLILGISIPLLMSDSPVGLISLGIGDSLASIIGGKYGRLGWPGTSKTIEGTIAFICATTVVGWVAKYYFGYFENLSSINWFIVCSLSGVLEGNSVLNDNILIPAFMLICEHLLNE